MRRSARVALRRHYAGIGVSIYFLVVLNSYRLALRDERDGVPASAHQGGAAGGAARPSVRRGSGGRKGDGATVSNGGSTAIAGAYRDAVDDDELAVTADDVAIAPDAPAAAAPASRSATSGGRRPAASPVSSPAPAPAATGSRYALDDDNDLGGGAASATAGRGGRGASGRRV